MARALVPLALAWLAACGSAAPRDAAAPPVALGPEWLSPAGTSVLGMGLVRLGPGADGGDARFRLRYRERPDDYTRIDSVQAIVFPAAAFAETGWVFADRLTAFARSPHGALALDAEFSIPGEDLFVVGYGAWTGPDAGRPQSLGHVFDLTIEPLDGGNVHWVDLEAGELTTKNWTHRPEVDRGGSVRDPLTGDALRLEAQVLVLYDAAYVRAPSDPPAPAADALLREAEAIDAGAVDADRRGDALRAREDRARAETLRRLARRDDRIPLPEDLARRLKRVTLRWR